MQVCRALHELIESSTPLQYQVALEAFGMQDGRTNVYFDPVERLEMLKNYIDAWRRLDWKDDITVSLPRRTSSLMSNTFITDAGVSCLNEGHGDIAFKILPSRLRRIVARQWTQSVGFTVYDLLVDVSQDLLILVEHVQLEPSCVCLLSPSVLYILKAEK